MKKNLSVVPLRILLLLVIGILVTLSLGLALKDLYTTHRAYRDAQARMERNQLADLGVQVVNAFAFERGRSHIVLRTQERVSDENLRFIDERRGETDRLLDRILLGAAGDFGDQAEAIRRSRGWVDALRPVLDLSFVRPIPDRDPELASQWLTAAGDLMARIEDLLVALSGAQGKVDAESLRLGSMRIQALQLRMFAGSESTTLAGELIARKSPRRPVIAEASRLRGRSDQIWQQLESDVEQLGQRDASAALARIRAELYGRLRPLQDEILRAAESDQPVRFTVDHYTAASVSALNALTDLGEAISRAAMSRGENLLVQSGRDLLVSLFSILTIVILALGTVGLLAWRFTRPLQQIMSRIAVLSGRESKAAQSAPGSRGDEFFHVRQALELLDDSIRARRQSEENLRDREQTYHSILASAPQLIVATDLDGLIREFSPGAEKMLGYSAAEVIGRRSPLQFHDQKEISDRAAELSQRLGQPVEADFSVFVARSSDDAMPDEREWTLIRKDGRRIPVLLSVTPLRNSGNTITGYLGVASDISARKHAEEELRSAARERDRQHRLLEALLRTLPVGVFMVDAPGGKPLIANEAALHLLGRGALPEVTMENVSSFYSAYRLPSRHPYPVEEMPIVLGMQGLSSHIEDMLVVRPDGSEVTLEVMGSPVRDGEDRVWASLVTFFDITGRAESRAEMSRMAYYDHLTRLPNRRLFHDRMQVAITRARREKSRLALVLIDLDRFKPVNDNLGHAVGDLLLKAVARRMQLCLRESDTLARIGGDEFMVILNQIDGSEDALVVAEKIRLALNRPFELAGGYKVYIACSIGVAIYPDHGKDEKRLARNADEAMYAAKEGGRNSVRLFSAAMRERSGTDEGGDLMRLVWHDAYCCGEASIDREHRELFDRANELIHASLAVQDSPDLLRAELEDLIACVAHHFENEELQLERYGYDELEAHRLKHQRLVGRALELRQMADAGELDAGRLIGFLAQDVVVKHMLTEDRKFFPLFLKAVPSLDKSAGKPADGH